MPSALPVPQDPTMHQSRWGFHPCSKEMFVKMRALKKAYWQAVYGLAEWFRWNRKAPQSRVRTETIRDLAGRSNGRRVTGPWPEPIYCPIFGRPDRKLAWLMIPGHLNDYGIDRAVAIARCPMPAGNVADMGITAARVDELFAQLKEWQALRKITKK